MDERRDRGMSRSLLRCRNPACPVPHGAVLARITAGGAIILGPDVGRFAIYLDTGRASFTCQACGQARNVHARIICSR
jgi:hypothetical protein